MGLGEGDTAAQAALRDVALRAEVKTVSQAKAAVKRLNEAEARRKKLENSAMGLGETNLLRGGAGNNNNNNSSSSAAAAVTRAGH